VVSPLFNLVDLLGVEVSCVLGGEGLVDTGDCGTLDGEGGLRPGVDGVVVGCVCGGGVGCGAGGGIDATSLYVRDAGDGVGGGCSVGGVGGGRGC